MRKTLTTCALMLTMAVAQAQTIANANYPYKDLIARGEYKKASEKISDKMSDKASVELLTAKSLLQSNAGNPRRNEYNAYCTAAKATTMLQKENDKTRNKLSTKGITTDGLKELMETLHDGAFGTMRTGLKESDLRIALERLTKNNIPESHKQEMQSMLDSLDELDMQRKIAAQMRRDSAYIEKFDKIFAKNIRGAEKLMQEKGFPPNNEYVMMKFYNTFSQVGTPDVLLNFYESYKAIAQMEFYNTPRAELGMSIRERDSLLMHLDTLCESGDKEAMRSYLGICPRSMRALEVLQMLMAQDISKGNFATATATAMQYEKKMGDYAPYRETLACLAMPKRHVVEQQINVGNYGDTVNVANAKALRENRLMFSVIQTDDKGNVTYNMTYQAATTPQGTSIVGKPTIITPLDFRQRVFGNTQSSSEFINELTEKKQTNELKWGFPKMIGLVIDSAITISPKTNLSVASADGNYAIYTNRYGDYIYRYENGQYKRIKTNGLSKRIKGCTGSLISPPAHTAHPKDTIIIAYGYAIKDEITNKKFANIIVELAEYTPTNKNRDEYSFRVIYSGSGININTKTDEESPLLTSDGKTLYFAARGRGGLGGYDMYVTHRLSDTNWTQWSKPENLGPSYNTPDDDIWSSLSPDGKWAYTTRTNAKGKTQIVRIALPE